jgi:hypothetical protein
MLGVIKLSVFVMSVMAPRKFLLLVLQLRQKSFLT